MTTSESIIFLLETTAIVLVYMFALGFLIGIGELIVKYFKSKKRANEKRNYSSNTSINV
jgi:hypothetical protein